MIRDVQASFTGYSSDPMALSSIVGAAGTYLAPNTVDTGPLGVSYSANSYADTLASPAANAGRDIGANSRLQLLINFLQAAVGGTSVDFQLITSDAPDLSSPVLLHDYGSVATAKLFRGAKLILPVPSRGAYKRYIGLQAITVGAFTAGGYVGSLVLNMDSLLPGYVGGFPVK